MVVLPHVHATRTHRHRARARHRRVGTVVGPRPRPGDVPGRALIVIASYYVLFATMGGTQALPAELIAATAFFVIAIVGFRTSLWWVAAGIAGHGLLFDWVVHPHLIANPGMPVFWPAFCGSIDVALGVLVAVLLFRRAIPARR